ncbi:MAG: amidophosphoribosyltransferase, partial [Clostridia bacterium]|nr:amidophosphoribosyltransferase [Clostridia bacterium]
VRSACPPIMFGCKYLNFSRSTSELELIARRMVEKEEGKDVSLDVLKQYADPNTDRYAHMVDMIRDQLAFDSLGYNRLDDMIESVGLDADKLCTYCWNGVE